LSNRFALFRGPWFLVLAVALIGQASRADNKASEPETRRITVPDTIQMTRWADRGYFLGGAPSGPVGLFSPDGTKFAVVVNRGNIKLNTVEYSILLFQARDAFPSPKARALITMSSSSNRDAVKDLKWLDDKTMVFIGEQPDEIPQVYRLDTDTGRIKKLTSHSTPVVAYDISNDGQTLVYEAASRKLVDSRDIRRHGVVITTQEPSDLQFCKSDQSSDTVDKELFLQTEGHPVSRIPSHDFFDEALPLALSPTGRYALVVVRVSRVPQSWAEYEDEVLRSFVIERRKPGTWSNIAQYMILDTETGVLDTLINAPISWVDYGFAWAKDGSSVVLSGAYLPLNTGDLIELEARKTHPFVVDVTVPAMNIVKITDEALRITTWENTGKVLLQPGDGPQKRPAKAYQRIGPTWTSVPVTDEDTPSPRSLELTLEEDVNTPPRIFVHEVKSHQNGLLFDLNPQFAHLQFGKVEAVIWKATDGHHVAGGIYLPPDYAVGKRYPLVIQTHGFREDRFWIDGPWSSAFAAQPLAAKGFVVLQVGSSVDSGQDSKYAGTPEEAPRQMAAYEGAIDYLDARALIDRGRVGIIGFSRTVFYVEYTLTHSKYRFRAASLADGFDGGYVNYLLWPTTDYVQVNGGPPAGSSLPLWLKNSPGFNLEKVSAAVRLEYYGRGYFLGGWQSFSGLTLLDKPVDFVWLPDAYHMLVKPWERTVSQEGTVDWFDFWLKDERDSDPEKRDQYDRWEKLQDLLH
jgi:dipeptidyl aminopeptidase/acylaminoacyl peptidase